MSGQQDYVEWRDRWPRVVVERDTEKAVALVENYYNESAVGAPAYTGARFEAVATLNNDPYTIGPADIVAVSTLSVKVSGRAAIRILERDAAVITRCLSDIRPDTNIVSVDREALGPKSAADQLWNVLRAGKDGLGRTTTSKLLAAKRPNLLPIWDSFVEDATGLGTRKYWWRFQDVLRADDHAIWNWLSGLRAELDTLPEAVSELRLLDVILWMTIEQSRKK